MTENPSAIEWAAARGHKWRDQIDGMEAMLASIDEPLIRALNLDAPCRVADVGCGGGGTTREIRHRAPAGSVVHGFDLSPALIALARSRKPSDEFDVTFDIANVATASPEKPYDRLVSRFGTMFFDDPLAAFSNLVRWIAPSGRFAFAVWGRLDDNPWVTSVRNVVAEIIDLPPSDPDAPGPFRYGEVDKLLTLLDLSGYSELEVCDWREELPIGGGLLAAEAATFALAAFSSYGEMLAEAGNGASENARRLLTERFSPHQKDGAVRMNAWVHIITGTRRR